MGPGRARIYAAGRDRAGAPRRPVRGRVTEPPAGAGRRLDEALEDLAAELDGRRLTALVRGLQARYRDPRTDRAGAPRWTREEATAYAVARMPATTAAVADALGRLLEHTEATPTTLLDLGGGTGSVLWAAADMLPELRSATVLERDAAMTAVGRRLATAGPPVVRQSRWQQGNLTRGEALPVADLAVAGYSLGELPPPALRGVLARAVTAAPTVVVVEPGTPRGYPTVVAARTALLELGLRVAAPCPHEATCPMTRTPEDWCHVSTRLTRSPLQRRAKAASAGHEDERSSYVVATRLPVRPARARVVRHPQVRGGHVLLQLCTRDEGLQRATVSRRQGPAYRPAREVRWGDAWEPDVSR